MENNTQILKIQKECSAIIQFTIFKILSKQIRTLSEIIETISVFTKNDCKSLLILRYKNSFTGIKE